MINIGNWSINMIHLVYGFSWLVTILSSVTFLFTMHRIFWRNAASKGLWRVVFDTSLFSAAIRTKSFWIMGAAILINKISEAFLEPQ